MNALPIALPALCVLVALWVVYRALVRYLAILETREGLKKQDSALAGRVAQTEADLAALRGEVKANKEDALRAIRELATKKVRAAAEPGF